LPHPETPATSLSRRLPVAEAPRVVHLFRTEKEHVVTELARRTSNGLDVSLLWSPHTGRLVVAVTDLRTDRSFAVDAPSHRALDVYHHPFAYAA